MTMLDRDYLTGRAAAEAELAKRATSAPARSVHSQLAQLYLDVINDGQRASEQASVQAPRAVDAQQIS